ncbi:MAG TPA: protein kinase [Saprospiraceae bacterium]|nr:protein kinase [Saprospiraceae bacterium]
MFPLHYLGPHLAAKMKALQESLDYIESLIENNHLDKAFDVLKPLVKFTEYRVTVSLLLSNYNELQKEILDQAISDDERSARLVQIRKSLFQLIQLVRETEKAPTERQKDFFRITVARNEAEFQELLTQKLTPRYTNLERISSGDNAIIYKADKVDPTTQTTQRVAIKVIKPLSVIDDENLESIREDLVKAKRLSNLDGIIKVIDEELEEPPRYIVTEYIDGMRLSERLSQGWPYQPGEIREMLLSMGQALYQGHQDGLVHNNLWPANILIDKKRGPRLSPFQVIKASFYKRTFQRIKLFAMYWSPEQINSDRATALSDQYSFALIAFELFKGRAFFRGKTILDILSKRLEFDRNPKILEEELKDTQCPPSFILALSKMLRYLPRDRYTDMEEVLEEVAKIPKSGRLPVKPSDQPLVKRLAQSYSRCRRTDGFYKAFYDYFLDKAPHAKDIFDRAWTQRMAVDHYTEDQIWNYQYRMVDLAMERLLQYTSISTNMDKRLQVLAAQHKAVGVRPEDYTLFLECLKDTILAFDEANWVNTADLDKAWDVATRNAQAALEKHGQNKSG